MYWPTSKKNSNNSYPERLAAKMRRGSRVETWLLLPVLWLDSKNSRFSCLAAPSRATKRVSPYICMQRHATPCPFQPKPTKNSLAMADKEKPSPLRFLLALAIVLLVVYCVSLSVLLVYLMRDYSLLKEHVQDLRGRVVSLEGDRVTARATTVLPSGDRKRRESIDSSLQVIH